MRHVPALVLISILLLVTSCGEPSLRVGRAGLTELSVESSVVLSDHASTRASAYAMSDKILEADGKLFVAWLDFVADARVAALDTRTGEWSPPFHLGTGRDNHGGPALALDPEGYLHAVYGPHHGPFQYRRSLRPYDTSAWTSEERFGKRATYPSLVSDGAGTLYCAYRSSATNPWRLLLQRRPSGGAWSAPVAVADVSARGYCQFGNALAVGPDGTLHMAIHFYDEHPPAGHSAGYLRSRDGGETWENAAGVPLALPVTPDSDCWIEKGPELDMRVGDIALDGDGHPWIPVIHLGKRPRTIVVWYHDGVAWRSRDLLPDVQRTMPGRDLVEGVISLDRNGTLYALCTSDHLLLEGGSTWGNPAREVVLIYGDVSRALRVLPISPPDPEKPNWLPSIQRDPVGLPALLYTHGGPGQDNAGGPPTEAVFVRLRGE